MTTDRTFQAGNAQQTRRLKALVARMSDADLGRSVGHGWTVADTLLHLAFWDCRAVALIDKFEKEGVSPSPIDVDVVNETIHALAKPMPPRVTAQLAVGAAETVDRRIGALSDRLLDGVAASGHPFNPVRHLHRTEHLDEIERALA